MIASILGTVLFLLLGLFDHGSAGSCNSINIALAPFYTGPTIYGGATDFCFADPENFWQPIANRPNARLISNAVCQQPETKTGNRNNLSAMFSFFGQALVSHDLNYSEELEETVAEPVFDLCANTTNEDESLCRTRITGLFNQLVGEVSDLLSIRVPNDDVHMTPGASIRTLATDYDFLTTGRVCDWKSSSVTDISQCLVKKRKVFRNAVTASIDGTVHYGSDTPFRVNFLRKEINGALQCELLTTGGDWSSSLVGSLLPTLNDALTNHPNVSQGQCLEVNNDSGFQPEGELFLTGDVRGNENIGLMALQNLFVREHNRLCQSLESAIPSIEERFDAVKVRVISLQQKIIYDEYLPALLGRNALPPYLGFNSSMNTQISLWFDTVGFRFGHSEITNVLPRLDNGYQCGVYENVPLSKSFQAASLYKETGPDPIVAGLISVQSEEIDTFVVDGLRNLLFGPLNLDLAAINIMRGRERGLCSYNSARKLYGLKEYTSFEQISNDVGVVKALKIAYNNDLSLVDPWIGGLAETHVNGGTLGELMSRILIDQFTRTRDGDVNWYKNLLKGNPILLAEIERTKLSDLIRRNTRLECVPDDVFHVPSSPSNPLRRADGSICSSIVQSFPVNCSATPSANSPKEERNVWWITLVVFIPLTISLMVMVIILWKKLKAAGLEIPHKRMVEEEEDESKFNSVELKNEPIK